MKYVIAVSGGVDSVVLLDKFCKKYQPDQLVVAHFDHGIRTDSAADESFVAKLTARYGLLYKSKREELGSDASEALARARRYEFLREVANKYQAKLVTAHHLNDVLESVVINMTRGTGWRGLAVMGDSSIHRPLLHFTKQELIRYALENRLEWVEDETNQTHIYLRNRVRQKTNQIDEVAAVNIGNMRTRQIMLREQIEIESRRLLEQNRRRQRYFFTQLDEMSADELLRQLLVKRANTPLTRPQRHKMLVAIKVGRPGSRVELGEGVTMWLDDSEFEVESIH